MGLSKVYASVQAERGVAESVQFLLEYKIQLHHYDYKASM